MQSIQQAALSIWMTAVNVSLQTVPEARQTQKNRTRTKEITQKDNETEKR
jgi:hypothetical protein